MEQTNQILKAILDIKNLEQIVDIFNLKTFPQKKIIENIKKLLVNSNVTQGKLTSEQMKANNFLISKLPKLEKIADVEIKKNYTELKEFDKSQMGQASVIYQAKKNDKNVIIKIMDIRFDNNYEQNLESLEEQIYRYQIYTILEVISLIILSKQKNMILDLFLLKRQDAVKNNHRMEKYVLVSVQKRLKISLQNLFKKYPKKLSENFYQTLFEKIYLRGKFLYKKYKFLHRDLKTANIMISTDSLTRLNQGHFSIDYIDYGLMCFDTKFQTGINIFHHSCDSAYFDILFLYLWIFCFEKNVIEENHYHKMKKQIMKTNAELLSFLQKATNNFENEIGFLIVMTNYLNKDLSSNILLSLTKLAYNIIEANSKKTKIHK